jgi:hypothetical protein
VKVWKCFGKVSYGSDIAGMCQGDDFVELLGEWDTPLVKMICPRIVGHTVIERQFS